MCSFSSTCLHRFIRQLATSAAEALSHNPLKFVCVCNEYKVKEVWIKWEAVHLKCVEGGQCQRNRC